MKFIVDIQGFQATNKFIVKEFSIVKIDSSPLSEFSRDDVECLLFEPPYPWLNLPPKFKSSNLWLVRNHHGIPWSAGDIPYDQLEEQLNNRLMNATYIFVKGIQKKMWLEQNLQLSSTIINLQDIGCPTLKTLRVSTCIFFNYHRHVPNHHCAAENGRQLRMWFLEKFGIGASFKRSIILLQHSHSLNNLDKDDIAVFPPEFLFTYHSKDIEHAWDKLPERYQLNPEILACRICMKHWSRSTDEYHYDVIDGLPPMVKECNRCIR